MSKYFVKGVGKYELSGCLICFFMELIIRDNLNKGTMLTVKVKEMGSHRQTLNF